jgi:hypothetical protein
LSIILPSIDLSFRLLGSPAYLVRFPMGVAIPSPGTPAVISASAARSKVYSSKRLALFLGFKTHFRFFRRMNIYVAFLSQK